MLHPHVQRLHSIPLQGGETPPIPGACFGRDELIEEVVGLAENMEPIALIGAEGIGKTSIALAVLHHDRIKKRFGKNRRFICCDQFPPSRPHLLARLSRAIGAGIENFEDLTPLRSHLSSTEMLIVLDNAESVLSPQGTNTREIYSVVDELCQFKTICLLITSRITTVPRHCKLPGIPTLSVEAARKIFYEIYVDDRRPRIVNHLLQLLDFHALSITLLAATAFHNVWDCNRLEKMWKTRQAHVLQKGHIGNLAPTINLSLASPKFRSLGPNARDLLRVVAFFPQGIDEKNFDWLFPAISNRKSIIDNFCDLSLTYRSNGFVTMLAPIRHCFRPRDPPSSPLLCATRDRYFSRLSVDVDPDHPEFREAQWIAFEDMNVEHLLDVFTSIDPDRDDVWDACHYFISHLYWYKPRQTILRPKIEALPDGLRSKPQCLSGLSRLFGRVRNLAEQMKLLTHALELERRWGDDLRVVQTLVHLSDVNRLQGFHGEGIRQAREALEISEHTNHTKAQTLCLVQLAWLLFDAKQLDDAEEAASRAVDLITERDQRFLACQLRRVLGRIHQSKGEKEKALHHFDTALGIASPLDWHEELFWIHLSLAELFGSEDEFDDANAHIGQAKLHAVNDAYRLGRTMDMQANVWCLQLRLEDAKSEALRALEIYENCWAAHDAEVCRDFLQMIERAMQMLPAGFQGELLKLISHKAPVNLHPLA